MSRALLTNFPSSSVFAVIVKIISIYFVIQFFHHTFEWHVVVPRFEIFSLIAGLAIVSTLYQKLYFSRNLKKILTLALWWSVAIDFFSSAILFIRVKELGEKVSDPVSSIAISLVTVYIVRLLIYLFKRAKKSIQYRIEVPRS
ncbi:MAG: hypothetical protein ACI88L_000723 [Candidatus Paceibacteria bacterium]|jgi:hypothetical protein